jgi:hypothetical protein
MERMSTTPVVEFPTLPLTVLSSLMRIPKAEFRSSFLDGLVGSYFDRNRFGRTGRHTSSERDDRCSSKQTCRVRTVCHCDLPPLDPQQRQPGAVRKTRCHPPQGEAASASLLPGGENTVQTQTSHFGPQPTNLKRVWRRSHNSVTVFVRVDQFLRRHSSDSPCSLASMRAALWIAGFALIAQACAAKPPP